MKIIRVFPHATSHTPTDALAFVGDPLLDIFRPEADEVHVSCTFTEDIPIAEKLAREWDVFYPGKVKVGGPAYDDPGGECVPGRYTLPNVVMTSRGCPRRCPWCVAWKREGNYIRLQPIHPGNVIQDNNLLACPDPHVEKVFDMLRDQKRIRFTGGLDLRELKPWHAEALKSLRVEEMFFAIDSDAMMLHAINAGPLLDGISRKKRRCYMLFGYGKDTPRQAMTRAETAYKLGFLPFAQFYQGKDAQPRTREWDECVNICCRPARMKRHMRDQGITP